MSEKIITLPSDEEREQVRREHNELIRWSMSLSTKQIDFLCDSGYYNNTIRGYLIAAAHNAGFTKEQTKELLTGLNWALSENNKAEAEQVSNKF